MKIGRRKLIVVVGLPGSGKSHLMSRLKRKATGLISDDFLAQLLPDSPLKREPRFTDSLHYPRLIKDLRRGKICLISDIIFCDSIQRVELETIVRSNVRDLEIEWYFFENNRSACEANARRRNRKETFKREIRLIRYLSKKYFVPEGCTAEKVWRPKRRPSKSKLRRRK